MKRFLPFVLLLLSSVTLAESGAYRVELIVFRNLVSTAESSEVSELRSFSEFPDLEDKVPAGNTTADPAGIPPAGESSSDAEKPVRVDLPDDLVAITQKGTEMDDAWRRLRSSQNYRPLLYAAWEQNRVDYYPPMRIHNEQIIDTQLRPPTPIMVADLTSEDPLAAYRSSFFQIDGSLQLRRSRFLHLFLDLELREEIAKTAALAELSGESDEQVYLTDDVDEPDMYGVYDLRQNRQISTDQMQYFDTPYFGALVYVSSISVE